MYNQSPAAIVQPRALHQLVTSARHHLPQHPLSLCTHLPLPTLDSARLLAEQVSHPPIGSTCLAPAETYAGRAPPDSRATDEAGWMRLSLLKADQNKS